MSGSNLNNFDALRWKGFYNDLHRLWVEEKKVMLCLCNGGRHRGPFVALSMVMLKHDMDWHTAAPWLFPGVSIFWLVTGPSLWLEGTFI